MIHINKDFNNPPLSNPSSHTDFKPFLVREDLYNNKCCYCEGNAGDGEVEHYRPQSKYPWLVLEWSNLLLVCHDCNRNGAKGWQFQLSDESNRVTIYSGNMADKLADSAHLLAEGALILHPEVDHLEDHLSFRVDGEIIYINDSFKGYATIEVCKLNRDSLRRVERQTEIDNLFRDLKQAFQKQYTLFIRLRDKGYNLTLTIIEDMFFDGLSTVFTKLKDSCHSTHKFSLMFSTIYNKFNQFISEHKIANEMDTTSINHIKRFFNQFKTANPL